jgi:hypothetical protein
MSPEHCVLVGTHVPEHVPMPVQTYGQVVVVCHVPVESQVCDRVPLHCFVWGTQLPVHIPMPEQTKGHVCVVSHDPVDWQV